MNEKTAQFSLRGLFQPRDLTEGTPWKTILAFALPIIIGLLAGIYTSVFIAPSLWGVWQDKTDLKKAAAAQTKGKAKAKKA